MDNRWDDGSTSLGWEQQPSGQAAAVGNRPVDLLSPHPLALPSTMVPMQSSMAGTHVGLLLTELLWRCWL
jgi:hypothetical protein